MLNLRMLYILIDRNSVKTFLAIVTSLGFGVLLDILLFLNISQLIGSWILLAVIAGVTAAGIAFTYPYVEKRSRLLLEEVDGGIFSEDSLNLYITAMVASGFIIVPGLFNTVVGLLMLIRPIGIRTGRFLTGLAGLDWQEAYEYLRLDRMTRTATDS